MSSRHEEMRQQCADFHKAHPEVWQMFCRFTNLKIQQGFKNYSVNAIFERIRWESDKPDSDGNSQFKLNNNYRAFYARRFMKMYPQHDGFFRLREQTSKEDQATGMPELGPDDYPPEGEQHENRPA